MSRRGEVPFVAVRVGRSYDVKEVLGLADDLKIERATALGYLVLWEEMILESGDALTGRLKGYTAAHVAAKLGWKGKPARLIDALKRAGVLSPHKGTFIFPDWRNTITGDYAHKKATDREAWRRQKQAQKDDAARRALESNGADVSVDSTWNGGGRPPSVQAENGQKERKDSAGTAPPAPAQSAGELASRRWGWLREHHKRPTNSEGCRKILGPMADEDWRMIQWALTPGGEGGGLSTLSKKRLMRRTSYDFLRNEAYLEIRPQWVEKLRLEARPKNGHARPAPAAELDQAEADQRRASALAFVLATASDPDADPKKKARVKAQYEAAYGPIPGDSPLPSDAPAN